MEDIKPILPEGTGTPYVAIFDGFSKPIIDPESGLPIGIFVDNFQYVYDETKEDTGEITIKTDSLGLVELNSLDRHMSLRLQWGWRLPNGKTISSPVRTITIADKKVEFGDDGITITLELSDASYNLKNMPSEYVEAADFGKYIEYLLKGIPMGIALVDYHNLSPVDLKKISTEKTLKAIANKHSEERKELQHWKNK